MIQKIIQAARNAQIAARYASYKFAVKTVFHSKIGEEILTEPFKKGDNIVVITPHPDDDVLGCAGTLALAAKAGANIQVIYITNGIHGTTDGAADKRLISIRKKEARTALKCLGKIKTIFLGFDDGNYKANRQATIKIAEIIKSLKNLTIFTPWIFDHHSDHAETTKTLARALKISEVDDAQIWQYETWTPLIPNRIVPIKKRARVKLLAIKEHKSQLKCRRYDKAIAGLNEYRGGIAQLDGPAEAFFALDSKDFLRFCRDR